jgi:DNA-binding NarL/FixJ family response regulator
MSAYPQSRDLLLVDDHPIILVAVKAWVESKMPGYRLHCAQCQADAVEIAAQVKPALAVVDMALPDGDGLDLIRKLKEINPACKVLVFSMQSELRYGPRALKAGASGYLMKGDRVAALFEALQMVEAGRIYCSPALTEEMMRSWSKNPAAGIETLSDREFQVFRLMGEGRSTKEISKLLEISTKTVDSHRENMKAKLGCSNSTELLLQARDWLGIANGNIRDA